jgi:hypothetical protein
VVQEAVARQQLAAAEMSVLTRASAAELIVQGQQKDGPSKEKAEK